MEIKARLGLNAYKLDKESHIRVDHRICRERCEIKYCLYVCPAKVYSLGGEGEIEVDYDGCLECGTCLIVCPHGALEWHYPRGGFGVQYRFG